MWRFEIEAADVRILKNIKLYILLKRKNNLLTKQSKEEVGLEWAYCKLQIALEVPVNPGACPGDTNPARYI